MGVIDSGAGDAGVRSIGVGDGVESWSLTEAMLRLPGGFPGGATKKLGLTFTDVGVPCLL